MQKDGIDPFFPEVRPQCAGVESHGKGLGGHGATTLALVRLLGATFNSKSSAMTSCCVPCTFTKLLLQIRAAATSAALLHAHLVVHMYRDDSPSPRYCRLTEKVMTCCPLQVQVAGIFVVLGAGMAGASVYKIWRLFLAWARRGANDFAVHSGSSLNPLSPPPPTHLVHLSVRLLVPTLASFHVRRRDAGGVTLMAKSAARVVRKTLANPLKKGINSLSFKNSKARVKRPALLLSQRPPSACVLRPPALHPHSRRPRHCRSFLWTKTTRCCR